VKDEFEGMFKEAVEAYFKIAAQHFSGTIKEDIVKSL
jgi:hypothetical protein